MHIPFLNRLIPVTFTILWGALTVPANAENLIDIYQLSLQKDATFQAARATHKAAQEAKPQARSLLLPEVKGTADFARSRDREKGAFFRDERGGFISGTRYSDPEARSIRLDINQVLFNREIFVGLDQADISIAQADTELEAARQDLIVRVAQAYFDVLSAEDTLRFSIAEKEAIGRQLEQAQKRFEVGLIAITDVKEAQADYDSAVAREIAAKNDLDIKRESLQVVTDQRHEQLNKLSDKMDLVSPDPEDIDQWVNKALDENLQYGVARFAAESAKLQIKQQRAGHYPTLGLNVNTSHNERDGGSFGNTETDDVGIGVQLDIPIYSGGGVSSQVSQARHQFTEAQEQLTLQKRETVRQTRQSYLNVMAGISQVKALQRTVESNQAAAEATQAGFDVGTRTSVDVLVTLRNVFQAERDYSVARYEYVLETLKLKQAAGTLSVADVEQVNRWLN